MFQYELCDDEFQVIGVYNTEFEAHQSAKNKNLQSYNITEMITNLNSVVRLTTIFYNIE